MKRLLILSLALMPLMLPGILFAQSATSIPDEYPSLFKGTRPAGMGNAFIAMPGSDENAPFYNPASINDFERKLYFRLLSFAGDFSPGLIGLGKDVFDLASDIDKESTDSGKINVFRAFVDKHTGEFESVGLRLPILQVQHKWFSASILTDSRTTISFRNRAFTNFEISSRSDMGGTLGGAYGFFDDRLQAGVNVKVLHRLSIDETITTDDIVNAADFNAVVPRRRATGVGFDLGLKGTLPTFNQKWLEILKPTAGFTWQDIGNTRFGNNVPDTPQSVGAGFAIHPTWRSWEFHVANDFRELNQGVDFIKKWNVGAEAVAPKLWFFRPSVRIGANQGYLAAGTTLDFKAVKFEFATYGEEAGAVSRQKELRRLAFNLSFGFTTNGRDQPLPPIEEPTHETSPSEETPAL